MVAGTIPGRAPVRTAAAVGRTGRVPARPYERVLPGPVVMSDIVASSTSGEGYVYVAAGQPVRRAVSTTQAADAEEEAGQRPPGRGSARPAGVPFVQG